MSEVKGRKSRVMLWTVSMASVLLVYFLSWPPIELRYGGRKVTVTEDIGYDVVVRKIDVNESGWSCELYTLPHWIRSHDPDHNPLEKYWQWWCTKLGDPGI